jgi:hypothetical protein
LSVQVIGVDGVLVCVVVVVGAAASDGVDLEEAAEGWCVEADAHEHDAGEVVGLPLIGGGDRVRVAGVRVDRDEEHRRTEGVTAGGDPGDVGDRDRWRQP